MLSLYRLLTALSQPFLKWLLAHRISKGKEDPARLHERQGHPTKQRPQGILIWIHAASVGEAQSTLILIDALLQMHPTAHILVTSGTVTSAALMAAKLPDKAFHQYMPLDHPAWCDRFIDYWQPDLVLWMESELWPNMLMAVKKRAIPAFLLNARLSDKSFRTWQRFPRAAAKILNSFQMIFTQTEQATRYFQTLGHPRVIFTDNLKYSATPLAYDQAALQVLQQAIGARPMWVFASTHQGEEALAAFIHLRLKETCPQLLTIIVPRHPERREEIQKTLAPLPVTATYRGENKATPTQETDIYIADTLGELGVFYQLSDIAVIGRSFSDDGGGGHNPIEAAQLGCAVLTGPNVQYQLELFAAMIADNAAIQVKDKDALLRELKQLLTDHDTRQGYIERAQAFSASKAAIIDTIMEHLSAPLAALKEY